MATLPAPCHGGPSSPHTWLISTSNAPLAVQGLYLGPVEAAHRDQQLPLQHPEGQGRARAHSSATQTVGQPRDANPGGEPPWQEGLAARRDHKMRWAPSHGAGAATHLVRWANAFAHSGPVDRAVAGSPLLSSSCGDATYRCDRHGEIQPAGSVVTVMDGAGPHGRRRGKVVRL